MKLFLLALVVFAALPAVFAEIPDWCYDQKQVEARSKNANPTQRCEFYLTCVEAKYNCKAESEANRYPIDYGHKYCVKFGQKSFTSQKGRDWRDATLTCLQASFFKGGYMVKGTNKGDCKGLTEFEFGEHARCYTQPGASICELARPTFSDGVTNVAGRAEDAVSIALTVDGKDLLSVRSAKQIVQVLDTCSHQIAQYAVKKMKEAGMWVADELMKAYNVVADAVSTGVQKVKQGGRWLGRKASQAWNSLWNLLEVRSKLRHLQSQRHLMAPEHVDRLDKLSERVDQLARIMDAAHKKKK